MNATIDKPTTDFAFDDYQARQQSAISFDNIQKQSRILKCSDSFVFEEDEWVINPYRGFAVVSMVNNNPGNRDLKNTLTIINDYINEQLNRRETYFLLPSDSYHQTIANTLSEKRYIENLEKKGIVNIFPDMTGKAFSRISLGERSHLLKMNMIGLNIFGTCIALLGIFKAEEDFNMIRNFRNQFYNDPDLNEVDVKWTRPFVGHITLAYLGREINMNERTELANTIHDINTTIDFTNAVFHIANTELRSYTDLSCFQSKPDYPVFNFVK
jgi:hypothetical protein